VNEDDTERGRDESTAGLDVDVVTLTDIVDVDRNGSV